MTHQTHFAVILLALSLTAACAGPEMELIPIHDGSGAAFTPIINGDAPDAPEHDAVVALHRVRGKFVSVSPFCSGTLIEPNIVITAAHCVAAVKKISVYVGDDPSVDLVDHLYGVDQATAHAGYDSVRLLNDIALLRLSAPVTETAPVSALPASLGFTNTDVDDSLVINFAGFGQTETGSSGVKLQADGALGGLGCTVAGCPSAGDAATQISYANIPGPCFGDSGGPAFVYRDNTPYVGGLTSYGDADCAIYGVSTRVDAFETWIADFVGGGGGGDTGGGGPPCSKKPNNPNCDPNK